MISSRLIGLAVGTRYYSQATHSSLTTVVAAAVVAAAVAIAIAIAIAALLHLYARRAKVRRHNTDELVVSVHATEHEHADADVA